MKTIACDVMGTLEGPKKKQVIKILDHFSRNGYKVYIWSNLLTYAMDAVKNNNLRAVPLQKLTKSDMSFDESQYVEIAIEDDPAQAKYLGVKKFIMVDEIPTEEKDFEQYINQLTNK